MKATKKSFIFLKLYIFEDLLIFACLILEIYSKYNLKAILLNGGLHFGFTMILKQWAKEKTKMTHF